MDAKTLEALKDARAALRPFADLADIFDVPSSNRATEGVISQWSDHRVGDRTLTVEMLKAAREAVARLNVIIRRSEP